MTLPRIAIGVLTLLAFEISCTQPRPYVAPDAGGPVGGGGNLVTSGGQGATPSISTGGAVGPPVGGSGGMPYSAAQNSGGSGQGSGDTPGLVPPTGGYAGTTTRQDGGAAGNTTSGPTGGHTDSQGTGAGGAGGFGGTRGPTCSGPTCCPPNRLICGSVCVDPSTNNANCGDCANPCASTQTCQSGKCLSRDGEGCAAAADCASGVCNVFFRDEDGDGYGSPSNSIAKCSTSSPPAGYVTNSGDCCDNGGNLLLAAKINPAATFQSVSASGLCGVTWDFNCNGKIDLGPDFDMFNYCPPCSASDCQSGTCPKDILSHDPDASSQCGVNVNGCSYIYVGYPTQSCQAQGYAPPPTAPEYRYFSCR